MPDSPHPRHRTDLEQLHSALVDKIHDLSAYDRHQAEKLAPQIARFNDLSPASADAAELGVRRLAFFNDIPNAPYDFLREFSENRAPRGTPPPDSPQSLSLDWKLLGYDIAYPLGVPASALTAKVAWIDYFSRFGFNIFTYCQRSSLSPRWRPSVLPGGGHVVSPLVAIGSPQRGVVAEPSP